MTTKTAKNRKTTRKTDRKRKRKKMLDGNTKDD